MRALTNFVEEAVDGEVEFAVDVVGAVGDLSAEGVDAFLPDVGQVVNLCEQVGGVGDAEFVVDDALRVCRLIGRDAVRVGSGDRLGGVGGGRGIDLHALVLRGRFAADCEMPTGVRARGVWQIGRRTDR